MKTMAFFVVLFYTFPVFAQEQQHNKPPKDTFNLSLSYFNHAEWLMDGESIYTLTDSSIVVENSSFGNSGSRILYKKKINAGHVLDSVLKFRLDSLENLYTNWCIMITSGNEYFFNFSSAALKKEIMLHHYYLKELDKIVQLINSFLPKKYWAEYLTKDTKQDCRF